MIETLRNVLQVKGLCVKVKTDQGMVPLVHDVDLTIKSGTVHGLVGESGSGKTVTSMSLLQLLNPKATSIEGSIRLNGRELNGLCHKEMRSIRGKEIALIMQNPMSAFSAVFTIGHQFVETIRTHTALTRKQAIELAITSMQDVNLPEPAELMKRYPFQLSGGMLQRVMIAITISLRPSLIIADEPTTALDMTNQLQVLRQLNRIRSEYGTSILLISHDLSVIAEMANEVSVLQHGRIVEHSDVYRLFDEPKHDYSKQLLATRPALMMDKQVKELIVS
ncbi:ABC transporter ATP-binding protein [Cohnella sp.]|uniref:ABC transporter ATP-binding protein n=1 Tax=Cohnella sp. TaxID=1883426 RepID=UPI003568509D